MTHLKQYFYNSRRALNITIGGALLCVGSVALCAESISTNLDVVSASTIASVSDSTKGVASSVTSNHVKNRSAMVDNMKVKSVPARLQKESATIDAGDVCFRIAKRLSSVKKIASKMKWLAVVVFLLLGCQ